MNKTKRNKFESIVIILAGLILHYFSVKEEEGEISAANSLTVLLLIVISTFAFSKFYDKIKNAITQKHFKEKINNLIFSFIPFVFTLFISVSIYGLIGIAIVLWLPVSLILIDLTNNIFKLISIKLKK